MALVLAALASLGGCAPTSGYTSTSSDAGVALIYYGDTSDRLLELWLGQFAFSPSGCLEVWLEGDDHPYTAALPTGSRLGDDGTITVKGYTWNEGAKVAFGRVNLEGLKSNPESVPEQCRGGAEVFAVIDVEDLPQP